MSEYAAALTKKRQQEVGNIETVYNILYSWTNIATWHSTTSTAVMIWTKVKSFVVMYSRARIIENAEASNLKKCLTCHQIVYQFKCTFCKFNFPTQLRASLKPSPHNS